MPIRRADKRAYGARMSLAEKKAMETEIKRQMAEYDEKHLRELDAIILWRLHDKFGFGTKRLREFYNGFNHDISELAKRYEMEDDDKIWLCTFMLKEYGVDLKKWEAEESKGGNNG